MKLRDIPKEDKPCEKLARLGAQNLTSVEILAIILKTGTKNKNPNRCKHRGIFNPPNGKKKTQQSCGVLNPFEGNENVIDMSNRLIKEIQKI